MCLGWRDWRWRKGRRQRRWAVVATGHQLLFLLLHLQRYCSHFAYGYSLWHPMYVSGADLDPFLIVQVIGATEHAALRTRSPCHVILTEILLGNLLLWEWQPVTGSRHFVQWTGVRACWKLAADFSGLQSRFWPDSHGRKRSFCPQTEMKWYFHRIHSPAYAGLFVAGKTPPFVFTQTHCKPTSLHKCDRFVTYTESNWSRSHWRWTCWDGVCEWPRSSGAGRGWCAPWVRTSSPAQQSRSDSQRCTWWWFAPRREWAQSAVFQYRKLWNAEC